ncbi:hypothetical protein WKW79_35170 [Variovorax robiniae]|uniref:Uncharacterized protein n=1 Tax=Variovorax robiniae TaxID=1836199 RepID=A0ABU8XL95_9BURK
MEHAAKTSQAVGKLLAVVEVAQADRVRCQAVGCGHGVYKRIHVVSVGDKLQVLGSDCFTKLFGADVQGSPSFGGAAGRRLTDAERKMLEENTAQLIAQFAAEHAEAKAATLADHQQSHTRQALAAPRRRLGPSLEAIRLYELQAKLYVRETHKVDPNLPGWRGLVLHRIQKLEDEAIARRGST